MRDALNPRTFVETRISVGGVGPAEVRRLLTVAQDELAQDRQWVAAHLGKVDGARAALDAAVARIVD